jgi:hypothetical protein
MNALDRERDDRQHYDDGFNDGYSVGKREVLDQVHRIHDRIKSKGYDNISKLDMVFAIKTIVEYHSN